MGQNSTHTQNQDPIKSSSKISEDARLQLLVEAYIAEYNQLREEINHYHDHQKEELYFAMLIVGGSFAALFVGNIAATYPEIFLLFPFLYTSFGAAYVDRTVRILRIATYLNNYLREALIEILGTLQVQQWEVYKKYRVYRVKKRAEKKNFVLKRIPELPKVLDLGRVGHFVVPSMFSIALFIFFYNKPWNIYIEALFALTIIVALLPVYLFAKSEDTSGIMLDMDSKSMIAWEAAIRSKTKQANKIGD